MINWFHISLTAVALVLASGACVPEQHIHPISEQIVVVPLDVKCPCKQPTTKPLIDRRPSPKVTQHHER